MSTTVILIGGLVILLIGVIIAAIVVNRGGGGGGDATQERLRFISEDPNAPFGGETDSDGKEDQDATDGQSFLVRNLNRIMEDRGLGKNLAVDLARADLKLTVAEFMVLTVVSVLGVATVGWLIYGNFVMILLGAVVGYFLPKFYVKSRQKKRLKAFDNQLGDGLTLMANGLRAGYSLLQAMDAVSKEMPSPMAAEFRRVVQEIGLGVSNERAFDNLLRRVPSDDLDLVITAINVQAEVGGNLSQILEIIGEVIRERVRIKGEIQVLTAQGQLSGYVISFLPVALGLMLYAMNQEYIGRMVFACPPEQEMCSQPCGWIMIGTGVIMIASGFFAIQKIIDIDV